VPAGVTPQEEGESFLYGIALSWECLDTLEKKSSFAAARKGKQDPVQKKPGNLRRVKAPILLGGGGKNFLSGSFLKERKKRIMRKIRYARRVHKERKDKEFLGGTKIFIPPGRWEGESKAKDQHCQSGQIEFQGGKEKTEFKQGNQRFSDPCGREQPEHKEDQKKGGSQI